MLGTLGCGSSPCLGLLLIRQVCWIGQNLRVPPTNLGSDVHTAGALKPQRSKELLGRTEMAKTPLCRSLSGLWSHLICP